MHDDVPVPVGFDGNGLHEPAAMVRSVPGINVDMFGIETRRAMICVPVACNGHATMAASKVFNMAGKFTGHGC